MVKRLNSLNITLIKEICAHHDMIGLQDKLLRSEHSANMIGSRMYVYGGTNVNSHDEVWRDDLGFVDLSKFFF